MKTLSRFVLGIIFLMILSLSLPTFASAQDPVHTFLQFAEARLGDWEYQVDYQMPRGLEPASITDFQSFEGARPAALDIGRNAATIEYELGQIGAALDIMEVTEQLGPIEQERIRVIRQRADVLSFKLPGIAATLFDFLNYVDGLQIIWQAWEGETAPEVYGLHAESEEALNSSFALSQQNFYSLFDGSQGQSLGGLQKAEAILTWYYEREGPEMLGLMNAYKIFIHSNQEDAFQAILNSGSLVWMVDATFSTTGNPVWQMGDWQYLIDFDINNILNIFNWACHCYQTGQCS